MSRLDSLRHDLAGVRRFARRLKDEEHEDPLVPALPPARLVAVPGRGAIFLRQPDGPSAGPTIVLLHGWALSADLNWFSGLYDTAASQGSFSLPTCVAMAAACAATSPSPWNSWPMTSPTWSSTSASGL